MVSELVENYEAVKGAETLMNPHKKVGACPCCQADVLERQKGWFCSNKECRFVLWKDNAFFKSIGKQLTASMVEKAPLGWPYPYERLQEQEVRQGL